MLDGGDLEIQTAEVFEPLLGPSRYKAAFGGRGSAKSHQFAGMLVERCLMFPRTRWLCLREHQNSLANSVHQLITDKITEYNAGAYFDVNKSYIGTPGNGLISFLGMKDHTAASVKSLEDFDGAWVEEAQTLSAGSLKTLRPTIRKPGSELWFSWNPDSPEDPVDNFFRCNGKNGGTPPKNAVIISANYTDNPWFPGVLREEMEYDKRRDYDMYLHVWEGGYNLKSEARVFRNWRIGDEGDFPAHNSATRYAFGADWGFAKDPTVLIEVILSGRKMYITQELYKIGLEIDDTPAFFKQIDRAERYPITADSARPETISYMRRHGFPRIRPARKGAGSVEEGVKFLQSYDIVVHPKCVHSIQELTHYSWKVDKKTGDVISELADEDNHVIDAIRYAVERERRAKAGML